MKSSNKARAHRSTKKHSPRKRTHLRMAALEDSTIYEETENSAFNSLMARVTRGDRIRGHAL